MSRFDEIIKLKEEYEARIQAEGQDILKEEFTAFFEKFPQVEAIRWHQYTPYFNDGDVCTFGVGGFYYMPVGGDDTAGDYDDGFLSPVTNKEYYRKYYPDEMPTDEAFELGSAIKKFEKIPEDVLEAVFGDHAQVTATREGFEVEEYHHD